VEELKATLQKSGFRLLHRTASGQHYDLMYERSESNGA
jgi:hypothetical protein